MYVSLRISKYIYITKDRFFKLQQSAKLEEQYKTMV